MFYVKGSFDNTLRFGDVINGFQYFMPNFEEFPDLLDSNIKIEITRASHFVVLTPCCSIERGSITMVPIKEVLYKFFDNPYFTEDLTVINRKMPPEKAVSPKIWQENLTEEQRNKRILEGPKYSFGEYFIYEKDDLLPVYEIKYKDKPTGINTGYYMIDFKDIFTIKSSKIVKYIKYPRKILELSIETRAELRTKISEYFTRVPEEDQVIRL